jgi:hypothetical protein
MIFIVKFVFLYFIVDSIRIVSLVSIKELSTNDVIVNINKGYSLRRIGTYSPNIAVKIVHTFVPFNNPCIALPETAACYYISRSKKINIVELVTMVTSRQSIHTTSPYDNDSVSRLIRKDISQVLAQYHPAEIINNKSIIHFVNDQFHYQKNNKKALLTGAPNDTINNYPPIPYLHPTSTEIILKQINNNKIDFDYLSDVDLKLFLEAVFSSIDSSYRISNVRESLNVFNQLIVGQSIFALRYCSLSSLKLSDSQPCFVISTLFLATITDSISTFSIFRLIPLPIVFDGNKYIYSNLPKMIGLNSIDQTLIIFNDDSDNGECIFSPIVLCRNKPLSISLLKPSCLSELVDNNRSVTTMCSISRLQNIEQDIMQIDEEIFLFYNIPQPYHCQVYSNSHILIGKFSISEAAIIRMPCNKTIMCTNIQIPALSCKEHKIIVTPSFNLQTQNVPYFIVPIKNMTQALVSSYQLQFDKSIAEIMTAFTSKQSRFKQITRDFATYILSAICFIFAIIFLYIFKLIKYKLAKEIKNLESMVEDMIYL